MRINEIKTGVFACLMDNKSANAGFVLTERGVIVIDTLDTPERGRQLAAEIRARTEKPILFVINTHHHYDHLFGNQAFDAPVVANCALSSHLAQAVARDLSPLAIAAWLSDHPEDRWLADDLDVVYPNVIFEQRLVIDLPPMRLVLQHLGGHTPDTIIVDLPEQGVLFSGDLVFEGRVPFLRDAQIEKTLQALRQMQRLGARIIVPGHGSLCDMTYALRFRDYVEALRDKVKELVDLDWMRTDILDCDQLPRWWTDDRPDLQRANVARIYEELIGSPISA